MTIDVKSLEFKITDNWKKYALENSWASFIPEFAEAAGQKFMKPAGRNVIYRAVKKEENQQEYVCNACGSEIIGVKVSHGETKTEIVPYCPKCEKKPESNWN